MPVPCVQWEVVLIAHGPAMVPSILEIVLADTTLPFQKESPSPSNEKHDTHSSSVIVEYYRAMPTGMKAVDFEPPTSVLSTLASARLSYSRPLAQVYSNLMSLKSH
jgi:hypothetical protein